MKLFAVIDHSGEANASGLEPRDTTVLIFGSPQAGTPVMQAAPLAALDCHSRCSSGPMGTNPNAAIRPQPRLPPATSSATNSPPDSQESTR
jgi:Domain of unknown function DUF302